jgi:ubiquinone/menaquinone biosynthesis C-methylase UbiE
MEEPFRIVKKEGEMKKDKLWYRLRGLERMEDRFGNNLIQKFIEKRLESEKQVRVLEIGFGEGKCLIDLSVKFPQKKVNLYGINIKKLGNMHKKSDFLSNARKFGEEIEKDNLPTPYFYDAGKGLKFKDNYFDIIISQVAIHYVWDKAKLIEEVWRTLKLNGKAFLHVDGHLKENYPDWMRFNKETSRFIIYKNGSMVKTSNYISSFKEKGFNITMKNSKSKPDQKIILIEKNTPKKLDLNLKFDGNSTIDLSKLKGSDEFKTDGGVWWGARSVFRIK